MAKRPWYKRYPSDFIAGTIGLSLEEKGAYSVCLDLIYDRGGPIPDDPRWIAGVCGCSVRRWVALRAALIGAGKLRAEDGHLTNNRASREIDELDRASETAATSGAKGGRKRAENSSKIEELRVLISQSTENKIAENEAAASDINDLGQATLNHRAREEARSQKPDTRKEKDIDIALTGDSLPQDPPMEDFGGRLPEQPAPSPEPVPAANGQGSQQPARRKSAKSDDPEHPEFAEWWLQYPLKKARAEAAKRYSLIVSKGRATPADLLAGVMRYAAERSGQDPRYTKHPATWLNQGCWTDEAQPQQPDREHPLLAGVRHFISSRSPQ